MKKVLIVAYDINPSLGSECGVAYEWVKIISKYYEVELYVDERHKQDLVKDPLKNVKYNFICINDKLNQLMGKLKFYNLLYSVFINKCKKDIQNRRLLNENISLIHCLTPAGIHSYNDLYKMGIPIVIGPVGGAIQLPQGFKNYETIKDKMRNLFYENIKKNKRWKNYFNNSEELIIGTNNLLNQLPNESLNKTKLIFDTIVNTEIFYPKPKLDSDIINILYCGRLERIKGCIFLLKAFENLINKSYLNLNLVIIGSGKEYKKIKKFINDNNLSKYAKLLGTVPHSEVKYYMQKADIFCLPTIRDNGGTAILEAMSCGLPIVTTDHGGPAYSVTNKCGIKIEPDNVDNFIINITDSLEYLINNKEDRIKMGYEARQRAVKEFSLDSLERKIINLYKEVLN